MSPLNPFSKHNTSSRHSLGELLGHLKELIRLESEDRKKFRERQKRIDNLKWRQMDFYRRESFRDYKW